MTKKEQPKEEKKPRNPINWKKKVREWIARPLAYVALFTLASYGGRHLLETVSEPASVAITILMVAGLAYIILIED